MLECEVEAGMGQEEGGGMGIERERNAGGKGSEGRRS